MTTGSSINISEPVALQSSRRFSAKPGEYILVTVLGYNFTFEGFSFVDCKTTANDPANIAFTPYIVTQNGNFTSFNWKAMASFSCGSCTSCLNSSYCLECPSNSYLHNGVCYSTCPSTSLIPIKDSYCNSEPRNLGYRISSPFYNQIDQTISVNYMIDALNDIENVLIHYYPYDTRYGNHPHVFPNNSTNPIDLTNSTNSTNSSASTATLTETGYAIARISNLSQIFSFSTQGSILNIAEKSNSTVKIVAYSLKKGKIKAAQVDPFNPLYAIGFQNYDSLFLYPEVSKTYHVAFVLDCNSTCRMNVKFSGALNITQNERTLIFSGFYSTPQNYQLLRNFTSIDYLFFELRSSSYFNFTIEGDYEIYALESFLLEDQITIPKGNSCEIHGCINCQDNNTCFSCSFGHFLTLHMDNCTEECPYEGMQKAEERRCLCTNNTDCGALEASRCDMLTRSCTSCINDTDCSHIFPIQINTECRLGVCIECPSDCVLCQNDLCVQCLDGFDLSNGLCYINCPVGQYNVSRTECEPIPNDEEAIAIEKAKELQAFVSSVSDAATAGSGVLLILGANPTIIWILMNMLQTFYYLLFINVKYPENVNIFLGAFSVGRLTFIPDGVSFFMEGFAKDTIISPPKFHKNGIDALFLTTAGSMLSLWGAVIVLGSLVWLSVKFCRRLPSLLNSLFDKIARFLFWSGILRAWITTYMELCIPAFLQLRSFSTRDTLRVFSSILAIIVAIASALFPYICYRIIKKMQTSPHYAIRFSSLVEEFREHPNICQFTIVVILTKRLLTAFVLVFFYYYPQLELIILILINSSAVIFLVKYKPYEGDKELLVNLLDEIIYLLIHFIIGFIEVLNVHNATKVSKTKAGWALIGFCITSVITTVSVIIVQQVRMFKQLCTKLKASKKRLVKRGPEDIKISYILVKDINLRKVKRNQKLKLH